jgi:uncharacterized protein YraI
MKTLLKKASVAVASLATTSAALASDSADTGVTEMNAGPGTFFALLGGVALLGVVLWVMLKFMNRKK